MRNTLICTVGTSLFTNIKFSKEESFIEAYGLGNPEESQKKPRNLQKLALLLLEKQNTERLCGAEINSITSICQKNLLANTARLIFLVSDTEDGKETGELLKLYYSSHKNPIKFKINLKPQHYY